MPAASALLNLIQIEKHRALDKHRDALKAKPGWSSDDVPCGHDVMVDMPDKLVEILEQEA